jgi:dipeptidyl-peptidase 4
MRDFAFMFLLLTGLIAAVSAEAGNQILHREYLRDHAETRGFMLGRPAKPQPTPEGDAVLFLRSAARKPQLELYEFDVATAQTRLLLSPEDILKGAEEKLSPEERALRERMRVSVGGFTEFELSPDGRSVLVSLSGRLFLVDRKPVKVRELRTGAGALVDPKFSPTGEQVAYVLDHDIYVYDLLSDQESRLTTGGSAEISHGLAEFVAREEMLRFSGYWWSPDARFIAYQESDAREVEIWHVADPAIPGEPPYPARYPRPGKANVSVRLGVVPIAGGKTVWVDWERERYPYMTTVRWEKNGPLVVAVQTRDQKELVLLKADAGTGRTTRLLEERDSAWVNVRQDVPVWLAADKGFLWASEQLGSGWQLEWRDIDGKLRGVVVPPDFGFRSLASVRDGSDEIVITARPNPTEWKLFRVSLSGGDIINLSRGPGCHEGRFSRDHSIYVETATTLDKMPRSTVYRADGARAGDLPSVAEEPPFAPNVELTRVGDGPGFYAALVRPREFDAGKQYPVVVYVYGGPLPDWYSGTVTMAKRGWLMPQWIADQGFVVVSLDGRGTPGRGHGWERAIYKQFGSVPLADQVAGLRALGEKYRELDLSRAGIYGWSYGGYVSALAVLKEPELYRTAVAGAPPTDWYDYDTHYTERYLGIPPEDAAAYREGSLIDLAPNLRRPLLMIHGTGDDNVYFRHTLKFVDALFRAGKQCDLLPLSGITHMVPDPIVNEQLYSRIVRQFKENLR